MLNNIWNVDETKLINVQLPKKLLPVKGQNKLVTDIEKRIFRTSESKITLFFVYSRKRYCDHFVNGRIDENTGTIYLSS